MTAQASALERALVVQRPEGKPTQLILLFHGVGGAPREMLPLARRLRAEYAQAMIVSVSAPHAADAGAGFQWFSLRDIDDETRIARTLEAMPGFVGAVRHWQQASGADIDATALIGFSQGGIMALESTRQGHYLAGRVLCIGGRYARLPEQAPERTTLHLFHGKKDPVVRYAHTIAAAEQLVRLGADVTADVIPFVAHEVSEEIRDLVVERLRGHIPRRVWEEALRDA